MDNIIVEIAVFYYGSTTLSTESIMIMSMRFVYILVGKIFEISCVEYKLCSLVKDSKVQFHVTEAIFL